MNRLKISLNKNFYMPIKAWYFRQKCSHALLLSDGITMLRISLFLPSLPQFDVSSPHVLTTLQIVCPWTICMHTGVLLLVSRTEGPPKPRHTKMKQEHCDVTPTLPVVLSPPYSSFQTPTQTRVNPHLLIFWKAKWKYLFCPLAASSQGTDIGYLLQLMAYHNE